jgi:hypothetical protein
MLLCFVFFVLLSPASTLFLRDGAQYDVTEQQRTQYTTENDKLGLFSRYSLMHACS